MVAPADEPSVTGADERIQPVGSDEPHWVDAHTFFAWEPTDGIFLLVRLALLPNVPAATAGVLGWLAAKPAYSYGHALDEAPLGDWDDLAIAAIHLEELEAMSVWELNLDDGDNGLSLRWEAWSDAVRTRPPKGPGAGRYDQSCRVRGSVSFGGRTTKVDSVGHRRHTWGVEDVAGPTGSGAHTITAWLGAGGRLDDRVLHVVDPAHAGGSWGYLHEGAAGERIFDLERRCTDGRGVAPSGVELVTVLESGRTSTARGTAHGDPIAIAASPDGGLTHLQPMRFTSDDGLEGYGLYERLEAPAGSPGATLP